ncbi:unnamed protein product, partial [Vitis vinifera]
MDSDQGKLFIGGISWETSEDKLKEYFGSYGEVSQAVVMRDKATGRPRGFGFVVFADPSILDRVLQEKHIIDGRTVEAKRALSREEQQTSSRAGNFNSARNSGGGGNVKTKKIFVGGLPPTLSEEGFRQYFEAFGHVTDVVVMYDQSTQRPRGFGFVSFDTEDAVDRVLYKTFHDLNGKQVEVKRALPKDANPGGGSRYQGYGASGGNPTTYDGRMDSNRYMQPQNTGGGFPPYGSSGYSAPGYGYGPANNGMGYGGYGGYGVVVLVQHLQVNLLAELLGMEIKVMDMEGMVEVRDLTQIQLVMSYRGVVVATWEVAMVMLMGIQDMEMQHGNLIHHRLLEIMELRQMVLMVGKLAMVVDIVLSPDKPSSSKGVVLAGCQACFGTGWIA